MKLNELIELAYEAHAGQMDKGGKPYILHPVRVALNVFSIAAHLEIFRNVSYETLTLTVKAAIGHDLIEDTFVTIEYLRSRNLEEEVIQAIEYLTRRQGESYSDFIQRCKENLIACIAKVCDLIDNSNLERIPESIRSKEDIARCAKYRKELIRLGVLEHELERILVIY